MPPINMVIDIRWRTGSIYAALDRYANASADEGSRPAPMLREMAETGRRFPDYGAG